MPATRRPLAASAGALIALALLSLASCGGGGTDGGSGGSSNGGGGSSGSGSSSGASGSASLSWAAPTTNTDGSALTDLAGYRVYYGTSADLLSRDLEITSANATSTTVGSLSAGTWYFAVAAVNSAGLVGDLSNVASKTVN